MSSSPSSPEPQVPTTPVTEPGVTVATGDPGKLSAAATAHAKLAATLEKHSTLIKSTAGFLLNGWTGTAGKQYQEFSADLSGHYEVTAAEARSVGSALKRFSSELDSAQGEGKVALKNAIHWMNEVNKWQNQLSKDQASKEAAEAKVHAAMAKAAAAVTAANAPHAAPGAAAAAASARQALNEARQELAAAETAEQTDIKNLKNAAAHFTQWQKKGGEALQRAEQAAGVAGIALGAVAIASPPVAKAIDTAVTGISSSHTAQVFAGLQLAGGGGGSTANWAGTFDAGAGASATASGTAALTGVTGAASVDAFAGERGDLNGHLGWDQLGVNGDVNEMVGADANAAVNGSVGLNGVDLGGNASAFVGGSADANASANLGPATASGDVGVSYGAGVQAGGSVDMSAHKIGISWNAGLTLGLGLHVSGSLSVDPSKLVHDAGSVVHDVEPWNW